jgi:hypothetical protein
MGQGFKVPVLEKPFVFAKSRFLTSKKVATFEGNDRVELGLDDEINEIMKRGYEPCGIIIEAGGYYYQGMVKPILNCDYIKK